MTTEGKGRKVRRNVRCNGIIKRYTLRRLATMTDMHVGEVYDRLCDGKGVIARGDARIITKAQRIHSLLLTMDYPRSYSSGFHDFIASERTRYLSEADTFIARLEEGSKPVYFADIATQRYGEEFRRLGAIVDFHILDATFQLIIRENIEGRYSNYANTAAYYKTRKDYKDWAARKTGHRSDYKWMMDDDARLDAMTDDEIIRRIRDTVRMFYQSYFDNGKIVISDGEDNAMRTVDEKRFFTSPGDEVYAVRTSHPSTFSSFDFRSKVEYIASIPSVMGSRATVIEKTLDNDIAVISRLKESMNGWSKEVNSKQPAITTERFKNKYRAMMMTFRIPTLPETEERIAPEDIRNKREDRHFFSIQVNAFKANYGSLFISIADERIIVDYLSRKEELRMSYKGMISTMRVDYDRTIEWNLALFRETICLQHPDILHEAYKAENPDL